jgi:8-oxo-dGTP pyrophosphatase MutT (NUDIX family)
MYTIYYLDNILKISEKEKDIPEAEPFYASDKKEWLSFVHRWIEDENRRDTVAYGYHAEKMFRHLKKGFHYVEAAGGVVRNSQNKLLFIKRWDRWDLPKGKVDKNEEIEACALREVEEETGVSGLQIKGKLPSSLHFYCYKDKWFLKKTFWFFMETQFSGELKPQREEDISAVTWLDAPSCHRAFSETYRSLRENLTGAVCRLIE